MKEEEQQQTARQFVEKLLTQRLKNGRIPASRPEVYFQCAATSPRSFSPTRMLPAGTEVRVQTWRQWSEARVTFNDDTGELVGWQIARYADPPTDSTLTRDEAAAAVAELIDIPDGAEITHFSHYQYTEGHQVARIEWRHTYNGINVEGDYLSATVHPDTRRVIEFTRHWHQPQL